ncbi:MAG: hypothetical protein KKI06_07720, partial [Euryarchaeota archaeon]|nr:hypothetical protein [Euryarchaeota archaeon]
MLPVFIGKIGYVVFPMSSDSPEHREREQGADIRASFTCGQAIISGVAINTPTLVRIRKRLTSDVRSMDAPAGRSRGSMR